jgi:predicted GNAT superfamily acetyltransferase
MPSQASPVTDASGTRAGTAAAVAAERAGVDIRELDAARATKQAAELLSTIWQAPPESAPVSSDLLWALRHVGNYVVGAYAGERLVGVSVAFFTGDRQRQLHSHISGVAPGLQGRGVGYALKLHQRSWALWNGVEHVSWTVDPLVRRNVFFNLAKLAASVVAYLPNFYGAMADGLNAHDQSDRLSLEWSLTDERVVAACEGRAAIVDPPGGQGLLLDVGPAGEPVVGDADAAVLVCRLPADILAIRLADPPLARAWRVALRDTLGDALRDGCRVVGVTRDGSYLLSR